MTERAKSLFGRARPSAAAGGAGGSADPASHAAETTDPAVGPSRGRVRAFQRARIEDVMVPRADIDAVDVAAPMIDVLARFRQAGHSRLPTYARSLDDPRGMVHIRDVLGYVIENGQASPDGASGVLTIDLSASLESAALIRPVLYVPASMPVTRLLAQMKEERTHLALVIDEYGGTDGLVTLEDLVGEVIGDIADEHALDEEPEIREIGEGLLLVDARAGLDEVFAAIGRVRSERADFAEIETIGGYTIALFGRLPQVGEMIGDPDGLSFEVVEADPRRLKTLRIEALRRRDDGPDDGREDG